MTRLEFACKYGEIFGEEVLTSDVLMRVASNLSDMQIRNQDDHINKMMNNLKEYIFDYISVEKKELLNKAK